MLKKKPSSKNLFLSLRLLLSFFILLGSLSPAHGNADATYYASDYSVSNGTYLSGSVPASLRAVDSDYFTVQSTPSSTSSSSYNPINHTLFGGTANVSGTTVDLVSDNSVHMVYRSYPSAMSAQTLYAHQEATTIGGNPYYTQRPETSDLTGTSLPAPMATAGRQLLGRFVYPLNGLTSIPASTWTEFYRAWRDSDPRIAFDSVGSGNNGDGTATITWNHVVGTGTNRLVMIGISIRTVTVSVLNVTIGGQSATFLRSDVRGNEVRGEIWYLVNPDSGSKIVTVTLSGISKASGGSVSYTGVAQTSPFDNHRGVSYVGVDPSISLTTTNSNDWIFSSLAISGTAVAAAHGSSQVHRYYDIGTGGGGSSRAGTDGDDEPTTTPGFYLMGWNMSFWSDVIVQAVALKPAPPPVGHVDIDILILKSDGTIRTTIATNTANSVDLTSTPTTLTGTYSMAAYTVVNQTDFLEIDYYVEVTAATSGTAAYLRIDDNSLPVANQTRLANIMLPNEYTVEVEFSGLSNTFAWTQINWTVKGAWTTSTAAVTLQLYDYALSRYPAGGNGFIAYTSNATANTDETRTQAVTTNPQQFRDASGNWKVKVKGVKTSNAPFDFKADWIEFRPTHYSEYAASTEFLFSSITNEAAMQLNFTVVNEYDIAGVSVAVQVWNYSSSAYVSRGQGYLRYMAYYVNETRTLSIDADPQVFTLNGSAKIRITSLSSTTTRYQQRTNQIKLERKNAAGTLSPLGVITVFLYALPVPFALVFLWWLLLKRRKNARPKIGKKITAFSEQFGMTHEQMAGRKMLLEVDPASDYNMALSGFVSEAKNSDEKLFIVTNRNSALHSVFSPAENPHFLILTSKTNYQQQVSKKETLLPASDLSVLLNACAKIQETQSNKTVNLLFDNVSDIILRCGFDKTYKFTRLLLEALSSSKTTALFVFIPTAHEQEVASSIRGLFQTQLAYTKDGPKTGNT
ncbi:MAG TPA: hypothetical protein VJ249_11640 [Candidatus Bathyarchaeia archaeon]|nr:hypothetical protein [Candidatus Bathyarchaeia archaeon]